MFIELPQIVIVDHHAYLTEDNFKKLRLYKILLRSLGALHFIFLYA